MLDPELLERLAARPEQNAPDVNLALAEQGSAQALLHLVRCGATPEQALDVLAARSKAEARVFEQSETDLDGGESFLDTVEKHLICHPNTSARVRDDLLDKRQDEPFFVLAASCHPTATERAVERAALWPSVYPVFDRPWLALISQAALSPLVMEAWSQDPSPLRRETVARLCTDGPILDALAKDGDRRVRRAVASNPHAVEQRRQLAEADAAIEVRARASRAIHARDDRVCSVDSPRFAAALRALQTGGVLSPDVQESLSEDSLGLDPEGAIRAAQVLPNDALMSLLPRAADEATAEASGRAIAMGVALRRAANAGELREFVADASKALYPSGSAKKGVLTGKARLVAWLAEGLSREASVPWDEIAEHSMTSTLVSDNLLLRRAVNRGLPRTELCRAVLLKRQCAPAMLDLAWHDSTISDEDVVQLAQSVVRRPTRGRDLPEDEVDLDPSLRSLDCLESVLLACTRKIVFSPRSALAVIAMDARRVRYVMTAMPQWKGRLSGSMLTRVLRQNAGALSAARSESRQRQGSVRSWTERMLNDLELALALGVGHLTTEEVVRRLTIGRHRPEDGETLACGAEVRAILEGRQSIRPFIRWATENRQVDVAALGAWLLLEQYDRPRAASMIATAVDGFVSKQTKLAGTLVRTLTLVEQRKPGRLEEVYAQSPRGKAAIASAIAQAYRAVGGLR